MQHNTFMHHAIKLAEKGRYKTAPNPCVGAVLVYKNIVVAEGYHEEYGKNHAEVNCLCAAIRKGIFHSAIQNKSVHFSNPVLQAELDNNIAVQYKEEISLADCVLYVTLEPCNHFGKTPPCSHAIFEAGIKKVVIGLLDPNPKAQGGLAFLKEKGVEVLAGICIKECKALLEDFLVWQRLKRPYCILKMACTLDGKIGPAKGHSHKISGNKSKLVTMQWRKNMAEANGAVMVGSHTFFEDNPSLTVRSIEEEKNSCRQPQAFIISRKLPEIIDGKTGYYCMDKRKQETHADTVVFTASYSDNKVKQYEKLGVTLEAIDRNIDNSLNLHKIFNIAFEKYRCPYIFCEGGAKLAHALLKAGLADKLILYMAPYILGDDTAKNVFSGNTLSTMQEAYRLKIENVEQVGEDIHLYLKTENTCLQD